MSNKFSSTTCHCQLPKSLATKAALFMITINLLSIPVFAHTPMNGSDVFVTYTGHSEVGSSTHDQKPPEISSLVDTGKAKVVERDPEGTVGAAEEVVFIPNEKPVLRNEDLRYEEETRNYLPIKQVTDTVPVETEPPNPDVLFISGKNYGSKESPDYKKEEKAKKEKKKVADDEVKELISLKLNCSQLDCDVVQVPVCGAKFEQKKWKHRLFLNDCFFRKVNCGFRHRANRYRQVPVEKCKEAATVVSEIPFVFKSNVLKVTTVLPLIKNETRRSISSRRALSMISNGAFCSHPCPITCTEDYDPQCATTTSGQKRVFLNHCMLDKNSCMYRVVWHQRPLSWCVGGKMADMQQNKGFIGWMQRNRLVDKKGRLTLH